MSDVSHACWVAYSAHTMQIISENIRTAFSTFAWGGEAAACLLTQPLPAFVYVRCSTQAKEEVLDLDRNGV